MSDEQVAWVVRVNSDLTEGRGPMVIKAICENEGTAVRLAKGASTQGCNGTVTKAVVYKKEGLWYGPVDITRPADGDIKYGLALEKARTVREKALKLGLSEQDISELSAG